MYGSGFIAFDFFDNHKSIKTQIKGTFSNNNSDDFLLSRLEQSHDLSKFFVARDFSRNQNAHKLGD